IDKKPPVDYKGTLSLPLVPTEVTSLRRDCHDFCTWMDVLISDLFAPLGPLLVRPGPAPVCTDAERITMALVGACCGWDQEYSGPRNLDSGAARNKIDCRP